ncbi:MAG: GNAT family N-acetyltransferase [Actinomycetota bacterium]|nr:GNAT family N-acetyltransferase [Actinomycetota bacterium]
MEELRTPRLLLRHWRESDRQPFAALNADPEVMRYFPAPLPPDQSDAFVEMVLARIDRQGWGLWAVEVIDEARFIGLVGLNEAGFDAHFTPAVEVGWRLMRSSWGNGYATEAAGGAIEFGFDELRVEEIVSFTAAINEPSQQVMERLNMTRNPADDFDHPAVPEGPLRRHVLFRLAPAPGRAPAPGT